MSFNIIVFTDIGLMHVVK